MKNLVFIHSPLSILGAILTAAAACVPCSAAPKFRAVDVDTKVEIGYGVAVADVNGDKKPDILLADKNLYVWYENPSWKKHVLGERLTKFDHVCIAAQDIDQDSKCEVAVGAGWNLALGCDFVVATPEARFCQIFTRRALSIDTGGSWLLPRLVGLQQAKRLTMLADMIGADEAHALGLVTWLQPETEIDGFVDALATRLAAGPPIALAQTKSLIDHGIDRTLDEALDGEAAAQAVNLAAPDVLEAFAAFVKVEAGSNEQRRNQEDDRRVAIGGCIYRRHVEGGQDSPVVTRYVEKPDQHGPVLKRQIESLPRLLRE